MGLEAATYLNDLVSTNPVVGDGVSVGDDHIRLLKSTLKATFPGLVGAAWRTQVKSGTYTVVATDNMSVIRCTGTGGWTLNLTAAATLGNGFIFLLFNRSTGIITIDPDGTEVITTGGADTATTLAVPAAAYILVSCTGGGFHSLWLPRYNVQGQVTLRKTADESVTSSVTLQDDDHLTFPIAANEEWVGAVELFLTATDLQLHGIKLALSLPVGASGNWDAFGIAGTTVLTAVTTVGSTITLSAASWGPSPGLLKLAFRILNGSTAGNVTLQWAQATSRVDALTVAAGSFLQATRVA